MSVGLSLQLYRALRASGVRTYGNNSLLTFKYKTDRNLNLIQVVQLLFSYSWCSWFWEPCPGVMRKQREIWLYYTTWNWSLVGKSLDKSVLNFCLLGFFCMCVCVCACAHYSCFTKVSHIYICTCILWIYSIIMIQYICLLILHINVHIYIIWNIFLHLKPNYIYTYGLGLR